MLYLPLNVMTFYSTNLDFFHLSKRALIFIEKRVKVFFVVVVFLLEFASISILIGSSFKEPQVPLRCMSGLLI